MEIKSNIQIKTRIEDIILKYVSDYTGIPMSKIMLASDFINDLSIDSLGKIEIAMHLEDFFHVKIADEKLEEIHTISDIINYIINNIQPNRVLEILNNNLEITNIVEDVLLN